MKVIEDFFRSILWAIAKLVMILADWCMTLVTYIKNINIIENKDIQIFMLVVASFVLATSFLLGLKLYPIYYKMTNIKLYSIS